MENAAFIVTTACSTPLHTQLLQLCLQHIRIQYSDVHIYVLDDHSPIDLKTCAELQCLLQNDANVSVHPTQYKKAGELNPYLFAASDECRHEHLVYIHDSVMLKDRKPIDSRINQKDKDKDILPLWYSTKSLFENVFGPVNSKILHALTINGVHLHNLLRARERKQGNFVVTFGAMSIFSKSFAQKMVESSNLKEVAPLFSNRSHRCLFERILSLFILTLVGDQPIPSLCGNIQMHPASFQNTNVNIAYNSPFVKIWQGR